jgi:hypothetical protein
MTLVGLADCVIALVLLLLASHIKPGRDLELAREVHPRLSSPGSTGRSSNHRPE